MQTVYVDVLLLTNFLIDYFLLLITSKLCAADKSRKRILLGSAAAALSSLYIFLPELPVLPETLLHLITALLICFITFAKISFLPLLKTVSLFYFSSAALAGFFLLIYKFVSPKGIVIRNGEVFLNISPAVLVISAAACYVFTSLVLRFSKRRRAIGKTFDMTVCLFGRKKRITAMTDSGNMLKDVCLDKSVAVASLSSVGSILPESFVQTVKEKNLCPDYAALKNSGIENRFRIVPFSSVGGSGILPAIIVDKLILHTEKKDIEIKNAVMAVCEEEIASGEYGALVNLQLLLTG